MEGEGWRRYLPELANRLGWKGNPGVAGLVKQTPGSIGYVELIYALQNKMPYGMVKTKRQFVTATLAATSKAAETNLPDDMKVSLTDTDVPEDINN